MGSYASEDESATVVEYGIGRVIIGVLAFIVGIAVITFFAGAIWSPMLFIIPLLGLGYTVSSALVTYELGKKQEAVYKKDGRYKGGAKFVGSKLVNDPDTKVPYSESALRNRRITAGIRTAFVLWVLFASYRVYSERTSAPIAKVVAVDSLVKQPTPVIKHVKKHQKHRH